MLSVSNNSRQIPGAHYFSVEGQTEDWYFDWLEEKINNEPAAKYKVSINSKVQKNPMKRAKSMNVLSEIELHI